MVGFCITDNNVVEEASKKEIVRRYYNEKINYKMGLCDEDTYKKIKLLMNELNIDENYLDVVKSALKKNRPTVRKDPWRRLPHKVQKKPPVRGIRAGGFAF